ncbi:MAG: hypothetical protein ACJAXW_004210 [Candidatus Azotimanducaceae bacterium]
MDGNGVTVGVTSLIQDFSARVLEEKKSKTTKDLLEYSQSAAKVGGWELDLETGHLYSTAETYRIHDTSAEKFDPMVGASVSFDLPQSQEVITR